MLKKFIEHIIAKKIIYKRLMYLIALIGFIVVVAQCCELSYSKKEGWSIKWRPAANITIDKKL